jgi:MFS family permease
MAPSPALASTDGAPPRPPGFVATVSALAAAQVLSWAALYYAFSAFVLPMMRSTGWDKPTAMGAYTLGLAAWGASTYAVGAAIDRGLGRWVLCGGSVLAALGFVAWSMAHSPAALYAAWVLLGCTMAMTLYDPAFAVLTQAYPQHYRQGITVLTLVGGFASTLAFPASELLLRSLDWRESLQVVAAVLLLVVAPLQAWALHGLRLQAPLSVADSPEDHATLGQALRQRAFWLLTACFTCYAFATAALWAHVLPAFESKGWSSAQALAVVVWIGPAQVLGRLLYVAAARHISLRALGLFVMACLPTSLVIFALADSTVALIGFALLFGVANGLVTLLRGALVPAFFGRLHIGRIGGAMGGVALFSRAAAPLGAAALLVVLPGYREVVGVMAAFGLAAAAAFWFAQPPRRLADSAAVDD